MGALGETEKPTRAVDALIITAIKEEFDELLKVDAGASPGSRWDVRLGPTGLKVAFRTFRAGDGGLMRVAATWAVEMGGVATANAAGPLIAEYKPRCIAMCGVCAGRRGDVNLGDVIIADRLWTYDTGKLKVEVDADGNRTERVQGDMLTYLLRPDWKQQAEGFKLPEEAEAWLKERPRTFEAQGDWILERLKSGEDPRGHADRKSKCPDYGRAIQLLWKKKWVDDGGLSLTDAGRKRIERLLHMHPDGLPEPADFKVLVGPIGTGTRVVQDPQIFDRLSESMRKVLGLEMEASAIGAIGHLHQDRIPYMVVMKGVMDHADDLKSDNIKTFAARASAECLIAFLRANLPSLGSGFEDIVEPGTSKPPSKLGPSALLNARHRFVPFFEPGRAAILADLRAFCDAPDPVSAWLIYGEGGMGKTRLLIEWCERLRDEGWTAGFLSRAAPEARIDALLSSSDPVLIAIDYAESRPDIKSLLDRLARARTMGRGPPFRAVLLARNAGDWWSYLTAGDGLRKDLLTDRPPRELAPLVHSGVERGEVFRLAAAAFTKALSRPARDLAPPPLTDPRFERVLYVHMAALASVEGLPFTADTLMTDVLEHEERFWLAQAGVSRDVHLERQFLEDARRAVVALTLVGGAPDRAQAEALLRRVNSESNRSLLGFLRDLYPGGGAEVLGNAYLSGLEPDLLGEGLVWRALGILRSQGDRPEGFLDSVYEKADERALTSGFTVLGRLSEDHPGEVRPLLAHLLAGDLGGRALPAFEASKKIGSRTAHAFLGMELAAALEGAGTVEIAERLNASGLLDDTVSLREVNAWVEKTLLDRLPVETDQIDLLVERGRLLSNLGARHRELGHPEEGLALTQEGVEHYRRLAKARPDAFLPDLAMSLHNLGVMQSGLGRREASLASTQEAVEICRALAKARPDAFLRDLARSLSNLGKMQRDLGQREASLASMQEAVEICRALAKAGPDAFLLDLARSLTNLGNGQSGLGQREASLASTQEAVEICRALAKARPDAFLPDLAISLNSLGNRQCELGQHEAALASTQEAVEIRRALAKIRPDAFLPDLAMSLNNRGAMQSALGQRSAALVSTQEAVEIRRALAKIRPDAFLPNLAMSLNNRGAMQIELGEREAALASMQEAVEIRRALAKIRPDAFLPDLAESLCNLGLMQSELGEHEAALALSQEALELIWPFFLQAPAAFRRNTSMIAKRVLECFLTLDRLLSPAFAARLEALQAKLGQ